MNQLDFAGRHAVVTGGASGLGRGIAQRLIASGGSVTLWDRDAEAAEKTAWSLGPRAFALKVDVAQQPSVAKAVAGTLARAGRIDALVNSAGVLGPNLQLWNYPVDAWREVMAINLDGVFICCREVVPQMRKQGWGRIVNIASVAGKDGNPNASAYSASKAAVMALTKSLGKELADTGIRVNCVTPAAVKTPLFNQMTPEYIAFMLSKIPMGRFGTVEEVAAMVCWLCTEECSFSTGAAFDLSGGRATY
ncbi:SDR family NAD(P)-dependent oxidoreductase [Variovorax defluvii]|uniref:SDR family NAD(P)-dependent oxidoreductase n=1 Tax=Variovorax defluvii TaxID=913761 RepID=A0ABP8HE14_9BURK